MSSTAGLSAELEDARAFADSVGGVLDRCGRRSAPRSAWTPGELAAPVDADTSAALDELGWAALAADAELVGCAGLGALELGRRLASVHHVDRLLGGSPIAGDLVRSLGPERAAISHAGGELTARAIVRDEACPSAEGLDVRRVLELGDPMEMPGAPPAAVALQAWLAAGVGYLAGVGQGALDLTVDYVRQRRAFGGTLAGLGPVQQLLAGAATAVRGVSLLAADAPSADALAHAGPAVAGACAACQQASGAIAYTLEYPLHRYTLRARALAAWNDALLGALL